MNQPATQLKLDVMRRVHAVHAMRRIWHSPVFSGAVCGASCAAMFVLVSIPHIYANMSRLPGFPADAAYLTAAFLHTSMAVQAVLILAVAAGAWLVKDILRNMRKASLKAPFRSAPSLLFR